VLRGAIAVAAVALIVLGTLVIYTFDPCPNVPADQLNLLPSFCKA
jgi:succinate dehydrogenase / fumarate reductase membrane anchor subunit